MTEMFLKKSDLSDFLESLAGEYTVFGPVEADGKVTFAPVQGAELKLDFQNSYMSPKDLFFPQSEPMLHCSLAKGAEGAFVMEDVSVDNAPRVVFGIRPCDAKAFFVLDMIFKNDQFSDPYWEQRRENTVLIGLGCNAPCATCFCTSVNCGPFHEQGLDALAVDLGDGYLLKPLSEKGEAVLGKAKGPGSAPEDAAGRAEALKSAAEAAITCKLSLDNIAERPVLELYEAEHWNRHHEACLNCGTCTYVCPTCHCFDIQDEVEGDQAVRMRNWDSCMSWLFTMHGSGHNPRPGKMERVRQRFMHKFKYIPIKRNNEIGCVGCGRCVNLCPVNIDVRDVVRDMNA